MFLYNFFDYKYNIQGFTSDLFSTPHIIYIIFAFISAIILGIVFKNIKHEKIERFLKILSVVIVILEISKISWESYWDISTGRGFNFRGLLPIYTCSLYIYTVIAIAWAKKGTFVYEVSLSFLTTIGMFCGGIGVIQCNALNWYPFFTFGASYSLIFHYSMLATGLFLLITGFKKLCWKDIYYALIPMLALSVIAIPVNYILKCDYMQIYSGDGVPLMEGLARILATARLRFLFTIIMLCSYMVLSTIVVSIYKAIEAVLVKRKVKEKNLKLEAENI